MDLRTITAFVLCGAMAGGALPASGEVIEEIIAHINDRIIVLSEYRTSLAQLQQDLARDAAAGTDLESRFAEQSSHALRDLIDHQLMVQRAADLGMNADTDVIRRLDEIRQNMNLESMEALEEAVVAQGLNYEDFRANMRDNILSQRVMQQQVGSRVQVSPAEIETYYEQNKNEMQRPAGVHLAEILISTEEKSEPEIPALRQKADEVLAKIRSGEDFAELARANSDHPTAARGGDAGFFEQGTLSEELDAVVAGLEENDVSDMVETRFGFMILKLLDRSDGGVPQMSEVENQIHERLYVERMQPALREYLTQLRRESFITVKSGYTDTGAVPEDENQQAGIQ